MPKKRQLFAWVGETAGAYDCMRFVNATDADVLIHPAARQALASESARADAAEARADAAEAGALRKEAEHG